MNKHLGQRDSFGRRARSRRTSERRRDVMRIVTKCSPSNTQLLVRYRSLRARCFRTYSPSAP